MLKLTREQLNGWMTRRSSRHKHNCLLFLYLKDSNSEKLKIYSNLTSLSLLLCRAVAPSTRKGNIPLHVPEQIYPCARELAVRVHLCVVKRSLLMKNLCTKRLLRTILTKAQRNDNTSKTINGQRTEDVTFA